MADDLEKRTTELEVRLSFQDSLLEALNSVVKGQQEQIDLLSRRLSLLEQRIAEPGFVDPENAKPPHY